MKILIIQLSDIHMKLDNNKIMTRKDKIVEAIRNEVLNIDEAFILINGDLAYSGTEEEYEQVMKLLDYILENIKKYAGKKLNCIFVPGNHDCYHMKETRNLRERIINSILKDPDVDEEIINQCCDVQSSYFEFEKFYMDKNYIYNDNLLKIVKYKVGDYTIIFNCYNTSWLSKLHEEPSKLYFPISRYNDILTKHKADAMISIFHHPFNWQEPDIARSFGKCIELSSDIVLTGHEHQPSQKRTDDLFGNYTEYIEAGVLQDTDNDENSSFNLILLDLDKQNQKIKNYKWLGDHYKPENDTGWVTYEGLSKLHKKSFVVNEVFMQFIDDIGATYMHPRKQNLNLEDIFIYPDIVKFGDYDKEHNIDSSSKKIVSQRISSSELRNLENGDNCILIIGEESIGKTALCRMLYKNYYMDTYIPIYIDGTEINDSDIDKFNKLVNRLFVYQYSKESLDVFIQASNDKKVLIIDNFDKIKLNIKFTSELIKRICKVYKNIIISGNDIVQIKEMLDKSDSIIFENFKKYQLLEFGHLLRSRLIDKWNLLGANKCISEAELIRSNDKAQKIVNTIIGKNYVPSYPIFLLTILQTIEMGNPHDLRESSYGYYYQFLITQSLSRINIKNDEIDAYNNFIVRLAYLFFEKDIQEISREDFIEFHNWFCYEEYRVSKSFQDFINFDTLINNLSNVNILECEYNTYKFKYKYVYYYSVAKYLSDNITREDIRNIIKSMCKNLYIQQNANIFMFLIHHSKDPFILNEILSNSKLIFNDIEPIKFDKDIGVINSLLDEVPKLVLEEQDVREYREKKLYIKDNIELLENNTINYEETQESLDEVATAEENIKQLDTIDELNLAFKTMEIIGQVLKNYWGSLNGNTRLHLGEEIYSLGLRSLNSFLSVLVESNDFIVNTIKGLIRDEEINEDVEIEKISKKILFNLVIELSYIFIKKIASVIGYEKLSETFKDIVNLNDTIAVNTIDISIKLDFFKSFPYDDIKKLLKRVDNNFLPKVLLEKMVINYLYMFETTYKDKSRICELINIPIRSQLVIDKTSTQKKVINKLF